MHVFRHEHVAVHLQLVTFARLLQRPFQYGVGGGCCEIRKPAVAAEGEEVQAALVLVTFQAGGHWFSVSVDGRVLNTTLVES